MEKRALIAVVISVVILVVYQEVVLRYLYPQKGGEQPVSEAPPSPPAEPGEQPKPPAELAARHAAPQPPATQQRITVETDLYTAVFTSDGGRLESFQLKKYRTTVDPNSPPQETVIAGQGGELPFGVELRGSEVMTDADLPYNIDSGRLSLHGDESGSIEFAGETDGVTISKRFTFRGDQYEFSLAIGLRNVPREYNEAGVSWFKTVELPPQHGVESVFDKAAFVDGRKLVEETFDKLAAGKVVTGDIVWTGYAGRHFLSAIVPSEARKQRLWLKLRDHTVEQTVLFPITPPAVEIPLDVYIGPKDVEVLDRVGHGLSRAVDLGYFEFIALPFLRVLKLSNGLTRNYGVDIILLTVVIKILFIPLTQRSFRSMREMQKLQPQMAKIREKFKESPEQMNKEIMELYRRHKVNPLGGCLPMVLQIPVFIGLYSALQNAVELRHAPFIWWINDLSAPDRLGSMQIPFVEHPGVPVLTLFMGASMFLQQWMTPSAGDPAQQRVMMIMPLMFTFMFVNFPSGLVLYWLVNNVLTIAQQYYINRSAT
jgi:YidC/Oxa1 family membrane protein insertase